MHNPPIWWNAKERMRGGRRTVGQTRNSGAEKEEGSAEPLRVLGRLGVREPP